MTVSLEVIEFDHIVRPAMSGPVGDLVGTLSEAIARAGGWPELLAVRELGLVEYELIDPRQYPLYAALDRIRGSRPDLIDQLWVAVVDADAAPAIRAQRKPSEGAASEDSGLEPVVRRAVREALSLPGPDQPSMLDIVEFFNGPESQICRVLSEVYPSGAANKARALARASRTQRFASLADVQAAKTTGRRPVSVISPSKLLEAIAILRQRGATLLG